jgi:hypothetical protein
MKKITIIGAGSAGLLSAVQTYYNFLDSADWELELIHDPQVPPEKVGQGTVPSIMDLFSRVFDIDWSNNPFKATLKTGIMYQNWGKKNKKFFHPFPMGFSAAHYDVKELREYILSSKKFKVIERNIKNYSEIDSDYIIDCSGKPSSFDNYTTLVNPLNSVILGRSDKKEEFLWTDCIATPDGWCFRIPNIDSVSYGYLFNNRITSIDAAKENFSKLFDIEIGEDFSFTNYIADEFIIDDRIFLNGNKLMFLEPMEANSNPAYLHATSTYLKYILGYISKEDVINEIKSYIIQIQNFILWHYQSGSSYDTDFWKYASSLKFFDEEFKDYVKICNTRSIQRVWSYMENQSNPIPYGQWHLPSFKNWIENTQ